MKLFRKKTIREQILSIIRFAKEAKRDISHVESTGKNEKIYKLLEIIKKG